MAWRMCNYDVSAFNFIVYETIESKYITFVANLLLKVYFMVSLQNMVVEVRFFI